LANPARKPQSDKRNSHIRIHEPFNTSAHLNLRGLCILIGGTHESGTNRGEIALKPVATGRSGRKLNVLLWVLQVLLAMLFMLSGVMKFVMPVEEMTKQIALSGWFLHFIGVAEILGAIGLVLPGILRIRTGLTPLAAAALVVIMVGATAVNLKIGHRGAALTTVEKLFRLVIPRSDATWNLSFCWLLARRNSLLHSE
jgi:uncharacterized membrane protein YphA (DoxX/SURF4 family)